MGDDDSGDKNGVERAKTAAAGGEDTGSAPSEKVEATDARAPQKPEGSPSSERARPPPPLGASWGEPLARFERRWTSFESKLITFVLLWQLSALVAWVCLAGMSNPVGGDDAAGMVFRAGVGATALGSIGWFATRSQSMLVRRFATIAGIALGFAIAPLWRTAGVDYFDNLKGWLQEGSTLTLLGGLRGLATRLTLWLALLGASLATAAGKHIHIDVIFRFLPKRLRLPAAIINFVAGALMCFAAVWGFFDHIAIESYGSKAEDSAGSKIARAGHEMGEHAFLTRKQMGLDIRSLPHVLAGERYDRWMPAREWNEWVRGAGFESRYEPEDVKNVIVPDDDPPHAPLVIAPSGQATRGMLVHDLNLVFPFGLLVIGLRLLLRMLLTVSGHVAVDPDEAHKEEIGTGHTGAVEGGA